MPLVRIKQKFQVTIPAGIRKKLRLAEGELLEATTVGPSIVLKPKAVVDRADVEAAISEGLDDAKRGRVVGPFKSVAALHKARSSRRYRAVIASK